MNLIAKWFPNWTLRRELRRRVNQGVELLTVWSPLWFERVDLERLDLGNCRQCVLGQLTGDFNFGLTKTGLSHHAAENYGFTLPPGASVSEMRKRPSEWKMLTAEWRRQINRLRNLNSLHYWQIQA